MLLFAVINEVFESEITANTRTQKSSLYSIVTPNNPKIISQEPRSITKGVIYSDLLSPDHSKTYTVEVLEEAVSILFVRTDKEWGGLSIELEGPEKVSYKSSPPVYAFYLRNMSQVRITFTNIREDMAINYSFFMDESEMIHATNSKSIPLEGGLAIYHTDLKKGDTVWLNYSSTVDQDASKEKNPPTLKSSIRIYALYYEIFEKGWSRYILSPNTETSNKTLSFVADLAGRYYIIVESVEGKGMFSLTSAIISPPWSQEWFWPAVGIFLLVVTSSWFKTKLNFRNLEKVARYTIISDYCSFITLGLFSALLGAFYYGAFTSRLLLYLSMLLYSLSIGTRVYASSLARKKTVAFCPYCNKKVDIITNNYCCGKRIKEVSDFWYLTPAAFGFLFLFIGYFVFGNFFDFLLLGRVGSILGGIIAWWMAKTIATHKKKAWSLLITGAVCSLLFPFIIILLLDVSGISQPPIERDVPGLVQRIRIAQPTLSEGVIVIFTIIAIALIYSLVKQIPSEAMSKTSAGKRFINYGNIKMLCRNVITQFYEVGASLKTPFLRLYNTLVATLQRSRKFLILIMPVFSVLLIALFMTHISISIDVPRTSIVPFFQEVGIETIFINALFFIIIASLSASVFVFFLVRWMNIVEKLFAIGGGLLTLFFTSIQSLFLFQRFPSLLSFMLIFFTTFSTALSIVFTIVGVFSEETGNVLYLIYCSVTGCFLGMGIPLFSMVFIMSALCVLDYVYVRKGLMKKIHLLDEAGRIFFRFEYSKRELMIGIGDLLLYSMLASYSLVNFGVVTAIFSTSLVLIGWVITFFHTMKTEVSPGLSIPIGLGLVPIVTNLLGFL